MVTFLHWVFCLFELISVCPWRHGWLFVCLEWKSASIIWIWMSWKSLIELCWYLSGNQESVSGAHSVGLYLYCHSILKPLSLLLWILPQFTYRKWDGPEARRSKALTNSQALIILRAWSLLETMSQQWKHPEKGWEAGFTGSLFLSPVSLVQFTCIVTLRPWQLVRSNLLYLNIIF